MYSLSAVTAPPPSVYGAASKPSAWIEEVDEDDDDILPLTKRQKEEIAELQALSLATQQKLNETQQRVNQERRGGPTTRSKAKEDFTKKPSNDKPKEAQPTAKPNPPQPQPDTGNQQFRYVTPAEDPKLISQVLQKGMDSEVTLTVRQLFAVAPEMRKHAKELVTTKRIPTASTLLHSYGGEVESFEMKMAKLKERKDNLLTAPHTSELRSVDCEIEGITVEAVIDSGSQIVAIRKDLWERAGYPIRSDHLLTMESANGTSDETLGLLHDLPVTIGGIQLYLQVQVVVNAPYEMLLGRPFIKYTEANDKSWSDGTNHLTLTDPNSGAVVTIPTRKRRKPKKSCPHHDPIPDQDF